MNDDVIEVSTVHSWTRRKKMLLLASFVSVVLVLITIAGALMPEESYAINYGNKYAEPSLICYIVVSKVYRLVFK